MECIQMFNYKLVGLSSHDSPEKIFIYQGRIFTSSEGLPSNITVKKLDLHGYYLSAGFIDGHVHVFDNHTSLGLRADQVGIEQGVTTIVDAGSAGLNNFKLFKEEVIEASKTNVKSLLNISRYGLAEGLSELADMKELMTEKEALQVFSEYSNDLIGLKARMSSSVVRGNGVNPLIETCKVAEKIGVPIMIHIGNPPPFLPDIFPLLRKGDIVTHAFHGKNFGIFDSKTNTLIPEALSALKRGIFFDIGHGSASFSYGIFKKFKQKFPNFSYSASTDIHNENYDGIVGSLMITLSKLLALDIPLEEIIHSVTILPAARFNLKNKGKIENQFDADFTIFDIVNDEEILLDSELQEQRAIKKMVPKMSIVCGEVLWKEKNF